MDGLDSDDTGTEDRDKDAVHRWRTRDVGISRRHFLKLCGLTTLGTAAAAVGAGTLGGRHVGRTESTGQTAPDNGEILFQSPLDSQSEIERLHSYRPSENIDVAPSPDGSGDAVRIFIPEGETEGAYMYWFPGDAGYEDPEAMYAQYSIFFPEDTVLERATKIPGPAGLYGDGGAGCNRVTGGSWSARGAAVPGDEPGTVSFDYYVYHVGHGDPSGGYDCGDHFSWDGSYPMGGWIEITQYVEMNTPGEHDGVLRGWVDGQQVFEKTDFQFRDENHPNIGVERFYGPYIYWGGTWGAPASQNVYFRDMTLSTVEPGMSGSESEPGDPDGEETEEPDRPDTERSLQRPC